MTLETNVIIDEDFILNEWVPALQSGKYQQGRAALRPENDAYCCLGVACDLLNDEAWSVRDTDLNTIWRLTDNPSSPLYSVAPSWKLPSGLLPALVQQVFVDMNDMHNFTFDDIAHVLEKAVRDRHINLVNPTDAELASFQGIVNTYKGEFVDLRR